MKRAFFQFSLFILFSAGIAEAKMAVSLSPSVNSPEQLGTAITWTAASTGGTDVRYRFRVKLYQQPFSTLIDYSPNDTFDWLPWEKEGWYEVQVSARSSDGETADAAAFYFISPAANDGPAITATKHPLVFLYSAPSCEVGARMRVNFQASDGFQQVTPWKRCDGQTSMNFLVAGVRSDSIYSVWHTSTAGDAVVDGPIMEMNSGTAIDGLPKQAVVAGDSAAEDGGFLLQANVFSQTIATDLAGNIVWYYPGYISSLTRPDGNGKFFAVIQGPGTKAVQTMIEFDLTGTKILETNAERVNQQLRAMGKREISGFHHEVRRLPNGNILALGGVEQIVKDVQGPGDVNVMGDNIMVFDQDLNLVWVWDSFDHLDVNRKAVLGEKCAAGGCVRTFLAADANDWTHGNAVAVTPDGNLLYSARHQDWVMKLDYRNGKGSGNVLWRLGKDGDFTFLSDDPFPWFSHQHDPNFIDPNTIAVFDNGNTRAAADKTAHSRGQVLMLNEEKRTAKLLVNADLGYFSVALGSAQALSNGNYHFDVGWLPDAQHSRAVETDSDGNVVFSLESSSLTYRSFRLASLYVQ